jgi:hypothetical protein
MVTVRVILDTNLWSSIGDEGVARSFDAVVATRGFEVLLPPSTLLEIIRLPEMKARQRIITAVATGRRRRLPTEAQSESAEAVAEIRRVRPGWMRSMPDTARVASLNAFWTRRVWRQALEDINFKIRPHTAMIATPLPEAPDWYLAAGPVTRSRCGVSNATTCIGIR